MTHFNSAEIILKRQSRKGMSLIEKQAVTSDHHLKVKK